MNKLFSTELTGIVIDFVKSLGACETGIATVEMLAGGPPSADLTYVLPGAKSAVCFALHYDQNMVTSFLAKRDRLSHEKDNLNKIYLATGIAQGLADYLNQKGYNIMEFNRL